MLCFSDLATTPRRGRCSHSPAQPRDRPRELRWPGHGRATQQRVRAPAQSPVSSPLRRLFPRAPDSGAGAWDSNLSRSNPESKYFLGSSECSRSPVSWTPPVNPARVATLIATPQKAVGQRVGRWGDEPAGRARRWAVGIRGTRSSTSVQPSGWGRGAGGSVQPLQPQLWSPGLGRWPHPLSQGEVEAGGHPWAGGPNLLHPLCTARSTSSRPFPPCAPFPCGLPSPRSEPRSATSFASPLCPLGTHLVSLCSSELLRAAKGSLIQTDV